MMSGTKGKKTVDDDESTEGNTTPKKKGGLFKNKLFGNKDKDKSKDEVDEDEEVRTSHDDSSQ